MTDDLSQLFSMNKKFECKGQQIYSEISKYIWWPLHSNVLFISKKKFKIILSDLSTYQIIQKQHFGNVEKYLQQGSLISISSIYLLIKVFAIPDSTPSKKIFDHNFLFHAQNISSSASQLYHVRHEIFQLCISTLSKLV